MQWGGIDSEEKRVWFVNVVSDYFDGREVDPDDLETILEQIMSDEFNTLLEDNSAFQVSKNLIKIYNECMQENYSTVERLRTNQPSTSSDVSTSIKATSEIDEDDSSDYESIDEMDEDHITTVETATVSSSKKEPIIDDEGFQLVTKRRR
ncbi:7253_t:CDS:2 [Acaulospora colombiana]|uniref:7253_t:CDS:1 n=1 Tax=Acaulospora colombiana TaxID=27376 RepID=A0ACA9LQ74_9GLOM|nr:7253_t:CDS:2 [Acaulospora colombiana]